MLETVSVSVLWFCYAFASVLVLDEMDREIA